MKSIVSQLKSLLSEMPEGRRRNQGYPDKVKELCVALAASSSVKEASEHSGVSRISIYSWIRSGNYCDCELLSVAKDSNESLRPIVLQEVKTGAMSSGPRDARITITSVEGITVQIPDDSRTLAMVLDRIMGKSV